MSGNDVARHVDLQSKPPHPWPMLVPDLLAHRRRPPPDVSSPLLPVRPPALLLHPGYRRTRTGVLPGENGNPGARVIERSRQEFLPRSLDDLRSSVVKIGPTSGCRLRIPFGVLGLLSSFRAAVCVERRDAASRPHHSPVSERLTIRFRGPPRWIFFSGLGSCL